MMWHRSTPLDSCRARRPRCYGTTVEELFAFVEGTQGADEDDEEPRAPTPTAPAKRTRRAVAARRAP